MINARAESLAEKPAFRTALRRRRCLIPADGFYEWQKNPAGKGKTPMYIRLKSGRPFAFAGLWDTWHDPGGSALPSFTIITTSPNELMRPIHDRMPVILREEHYQRWLDPAERDPPPISSLSSHPFRPTKCSPRPSRALSTTHPTMHPTASPAPPMSLPPRPPAPAKRRAPQRKTDPGLFG